MKKRKLCPEDTLLEQFHCLRQIPQLSHADCRRVLELLNDDKDHKGTFTASKVHQKFPVTLPAVRELVLQDGKERCVFHVFSLPECFQNKVNACPAFAESFDIALEASQNALELVLFWDEAVPGNVLAPDLRRKAALCYCSIQELPVRFADTCWLTLAVCRSQELQKIRQGYPKSMTALLTQLKQDCKDGFMIETKSGPQLVFIRSIVVFMDADGIRLTLGNKGSSGFKPCWLCQNVVGLNHFDLAETIHISNPDIAGYKAHTLESLRDIQVYLQNLPSKSARAKAETLLGWNTEGMAESFLLQPALADLVGVDKVLYDPMHCFVANGLCNQELGYWWEAVTTKTQIRLQQLRLYATTCWKSENPSEVALAFAEKNWVEGKDYRGEASNTLLVLPICAAFGCEILKDEKELQKENESLLALYAVICSWLHCKRGGRLYITQLQSQQTKHATKFTECYGQEWARPKLHYSRHLPQQFALGYVMDAFPTERKHINFKSHVAPNRKRLENFSKFCLLELGEQDLRMSESDSLIKTTFRGKVSKCPHLAAACEDPDAAVAPRIMHKGVTYGKEQFKIVAPKQAVEILGACKIRTTHYLLCVELTFHAEIAPNFTRWQSPATSKNIVQLQLEDAQKAHNARYIRIEYHSDIRDVWLLVG